MTGMNTRPATPLLLAVLAAFQSALAAGAPWGRASYGGQHSGRLPARLRAISTGASLLYSAGAAVLASSRTVPSARRSTLRGCVALAAVGTVTNTISRSPVERLWTVWSLALGAASLHELRRTAGNTGRR